MTAESKIRTKLKAFCANCKGERNCEIKGHPEPVAVMVIMIGGPTGICSSVVDVTTCLHNPHPVIPSHFILSDMVAREIRSMRVTSKSEPGPLGSNGNVQGGSTHLSVISNTSGPETCSPAYCKYMKHLTMISTFSPPSGCVLPSMWPRKYWA